MSRELNSMCVEEMNKLKTCTYVIKIEEKTIFFNAEMEVGHW